MEKGAPSAVPEERLASFIRATFGSVWTLDALLLLAEDEARAWSAPDLVEAMRASDLIVDQALEQLVAAGLVVIEREGRARYAPVSATLAEQVDRTRMLYATSPDRVRRAIARKNRGR